MGGVWLEWGPAGEHSDMSDVGGRQRFGEKG
jgi:hypothetical protein